MAFAAIHKASGKYGIISAPFLALHQSLTQLTPFGFSIIHVWLPQELQNQNHSAFIISISVVSVFLIK